MSAIILASQSPRRKQLLEWAEVDFKVIVNPTNETYPAHLSISEVPVYIARKKAEAILPMSDGKLVIAADTIVVIGEEIINKPANREDAILMLTKLNGRTHQVITGVVMVKGEKQISFADITDVSFHTLTIEQITFYVDKYKPYDKAGAYAIQEWIGVVGIKGIQGDFYNVMGLPVSRVLQSLKEFSPDPV
jgi:septum formation protein